VLSMLKTILNSEGYGLSKVNLIKSNVDYDAFVLLFMQDKDIRNTKEWEREAIANWTIETNTDTYTDIIGDDTFQDVDWLYKFDTVETLDNGGNFVAASDYYLVPETGTYRFYVNIQDFAITAEDNAGTPVSIKDDDGTAGKLTVKFMFYDNNTSSVIYSYTDNLAFPGSHDSYIDTKYVELTAGTRVSVYVQVTGEAQVATGQTSAFSINITDSPVEMDTSRYYGAGSTVDITPLLPDISALEFISKVFKYLNIYTFYREETKTLELYSGRADTVEADEIELIEVSEQFEEPANYWFRFATDKAAAPDDLYLDNGKDIDKELKFDFSRTLISDSFRVFNSVTNVIPVMWQGDNVSPLKWQDRFSPPSWSTKGNLRVLEYLGKESVGDYYQTYGNVNDTNWASRKLYPKFAEIDPRELYRYELTLQGVTLVGKAQIRSIWNLYDQSWFKRPLYVKGYGVYWLEKAEQINGDMYKLTFIK